MPQMELDGVEGVTRRNYAVDETESIADMPPGAGPRTIPLPDCQHGPVYRDAGETDHG